MEANHTDLELVRRVQNGDKQAFNLLILKYQYRVRHLVNRFVRDPAEQEDVVQEAFIKAYRALAGFRGDSAFYTWLYRIAVNASKNHLAAVGRRPPVRDVSADEAEKLYDVNGLVEINTPEEILKNDEMVEAINEAIRLLPYELRQVIRLRELDGLSYEDIADVMQCPVGTVRSRIFRAREAITQAIEALE